MNARIRLRALKVHEAAQVAKRETQPQAQDGAPSPHHNPLSSSAQSIGERALQFASHQVRLADNSPRLVKELSGSWASSHASQSASPSATGEGDQLPLPGGLPHVYEAAISLTLKHGWEILHGGPDAVPAWTALHWAAAEGRADVCSLLLAAAADPGFQDEVGKTPLNYANEHRHPAIANLLANAVQLPRHRDIDRTRSSTCNVENSAAQQASLEDNLLEDWGDVKAIAQRMEAQLKFAHWKDAGDALVDRSDTRGTPVSSRGVLWADDQQHV
eukprot:gnl/TRDRNA2_/TRDRNA2_174627_c2_seq3.p1 gnl/TRDRNA2_/TRDRNA2_174627_c2~~gnl/TRDRNA2_/TRDRNA2_174627_c2_seq3.p1  ORF type:complete len:273 (-),score=38.57 gnl/TRDRNA2_/TRDRNA2_174627_c2_seq3:55-873(-)